MGRTRELYMLYSEKRFIELEQEQIDELWYQYYKKLKKDYGKEK